MARKIAITGTIGSGKSTVSILLRRRRMLVFDADRYSRICMYPESPACAKIIEVFGSGILDEAGEIDRSRLAAVVFGNPAMRRKLEEIIHPEVKAGLLNFFQAHKDQPLLFAEIPLLYEVGWQDLFDDCIVVTCSHATALKRLHEDRGMSAEAAESRLAAQMPAEEKCRLADYVITNDSSIQELDQKVRELLGTLREESRHGA